MNYMAEEISKEEEYLNNWKRTQADLINYKKDELKRLEEIVRFANEEVILEVFDVVGNLEIATGHVKDEGLKQVINQFESLLKKYGVERIPVDGQKFNPEVHEAVEPLDDSKPLAEVRAGYTMHGKVIRPTRVKN